jgi:site-specific DNA recombinase
MNETKRVGIWIRVSTDMQVKDESPEHHEKRARYYCEAKGWQVVEVYRLDAVSGKAIIGHAEARRMLADIREGRISGLVFSKLARLARSTKELLEFAEIFRKEGADLISLAENIDTSSPAGRLFFTIIAAMAEWEREEISARVAASVPIRARMGKPLNGQASFGYAWRENAFVIEAKEAPVRALMYELFLKHQRIKTTAKALNALGYRTRNGSAFSGPTVTRLIRDTAAKGERRANHTQAVGNSKQWALKPETEWVITPCPAIVSAALWNECNSILDIQQAQAKKRGPKAVHLLSGYVQCSCGKTMYVFHSSRVYTCKPCNRRIPADDIDEIYLLHLKEYLSALNITEYLEQSDSALQEKKELLAVSMKERARIAKRVTELVNLRLDGEMSKEVFGDQFKPLEEQLKQLDTQLPELEAEIDVRTIQLMSSGTVMQEAKTLADEWPSLSFEQKRAVVETITSKIEIDQEDITITLAYLPPISQNGGKRERSANHTLSKKFGKRWR